MTRVKHKGFLEKIDPSPLGISSNSIGVMLSMYHAQPSSFSISSSASIESYAQ